MTPERLAYDEIPIEVLEAAARKLFHHEWMPDGPRWDDICEEDRDIFRNASRAVLTAAAPLLIAEGRREALAETTVGRCWSCDHPMPSHADEGCWYSVSQAVIDTNTVCVCSVPRRTDAEKLTPASAERQLRESRERQAGLDMDRIERARIARGGAS